MGNASVIWGYVFDTEELVKTCSLKELTIGNLKDFLKKETKNLDVEWNSTGVNTKYINLRTGHSKYNKSYFKKDFFSNLQFVVGTCLAHVSVHCAGFVGTRRFLEDNLDEEGMKEVIQDFRNVFPNRRWRINSLYEILLVDSYSRDIEGKRQDYKILEYDEYEK